MSTTKRTFIRHLGLTCICIVASCTQGATIGELTESNIDNPNGPDGRCGGEIAERVFSFAVCSCENIALAGGLRTFAEGEAEGSGGAAVGVNGGVSYAGEFDVDGTMEVGGSNLNFGGDAAINGDLAVAGNVVYAGTLDVSRNLRTEGTVIGIGAISTGGEQSQGEVLPPCGCDDAQLLDVGAAVDAAAAQNDNESAGVDAAAYAAVSGTTELALAGGAIYLDSVAGAGTLRISASAPTSVYIGGDVANAGSIEASVEGDGSLDIYIKGNLAIAGDSTFGPVDDPGKVRVYVGGPGEIAMAGGMVFGGNLYAPKAGVSAAGSLEVHGSLFARNISLAGGLDVYHDRDVQHAGEECVPPAEPQEPENPSEVDPPEVDPPASEVPPTCESPLECSSGLVCAPDGECGECNDDSECEGAQVCEQGACRPMLR